MKRGNWTEYIPLATIDVYKRHIDLLHFSRLLKTLWPLNFYQRTPRGLTFLKITKLSLWVVTGRASIVKIVTKTADTLRFFLKKWQREWNFGSVYWKREPVAEKWAELWICVNKNAQDNCSNTPLLSERLQKKSWLKEI